MSQDITEREKDEDEQRRLAQQLLNLRDEEHPRVARDLHESASQSLAALKMILSRLAEAVPPNAENQRDLLESSLTLAEEAIREVRTVSHLLHPRVFDDAGLESALRWYAAEFYERSQVAVLVEVASKLGRLPEETETAIFRIVQEALTNVHPHSSSRTAVIRVSGRNRDTVVEVEDKGHGMPMPSESTGWLSPMGIGLAGIHQRVKQLNGKFESKAPRGKEPRFAWSSPLPKMESPAGPGNPKMTTPQKGYRILVVDDHDVVRRGVRALLESQVGVEGCSEGANGVEALDQIKKNKTDLVVFDLTTSEMNGLEAARAIR
jgi:signal transduction histidine kinase